MKPHAATALPPDIYDDDEEFDEAIELSAERAGEMARGLTEIGREYPHISCPNRLVLITVAGGMMVESGLGVRWIIRRDCSEHLALLTALIRPELIDAWTAGSC